MTGSIPGMAGSEGAAGSGGLVLVLNSGSSSVKFALLTPDTGERVLGGVAEQVGTPEAVLRIRRYPGDAVDEPLPDGSYQAVISRILDRLADAGAQGGPAPLSSASATGSSTGATGSAPRRWWTTRSSPRSASSPGWRRCTTRRTWPASRRSAPSGPNSPRSPCSTPRSTRPCRPSPSATRYPQEWYTRYGVRRYGFHGTSHRFVSEKAAALLGKPPGELRLVTAHLGNGCSAAAIRDGVSVDTTMGLTPMEGLVMGTRSGDVDPGVFGYLADRTGQTSEELTQVLDTQSGLLGLSGVGNDMRTVEAAAARGDERAQLALEVFVHRLAKAIAGLVTSLERLDALVFTGGIGENSPVVRGLVLRHLGFLGLAEDPEANAGHGRSTGGRISRPGPVQALVVPTDEELMIARDTARLVAGPAIA